MGYIRHHAIIVTTFDESLVKEAHEMARQVFASVSEILQSQVNSYYSFFIPPDGSKEGWRESDLGDSQRKTFMDWCDSKALDDKSNSICAVEIRYSDDDGKLKFERKTGL